MKHGLPGPAVEKIRAVFARHPQVEKVVLYGSRARGDYKNSSDIDMVICDAGGIDRILLGKIIFELDDLLLPYMIDLSLFTDINDPDLLAHIRRVGAPFYVKAA